MIFVGAKWLSTVCWWQWALVCFLWYLCMQCCGPLAYSVRSNMTLGSFVASAALGLYIGLVGYAIVWMTGIFERDEEQDRTRR